jgi:hypothetical protein
MSAGIILRCLFLRDYRAAREKAETYMALLRENGFSHSEAYGWLFVGHAEVQEGAIDEGISAILRGREMFAAASGDILNVQHSNQAGRRVPDRPTPCRGTGGSQ